MSDLAGLRPAPAGPRAEHEQCYPPAGASPEAGPAKAPTGRPNAATVRGGRRFAAPLGAAPDWRPDAGRVRSFEAAAAGLEADRTELGEPEEGRKLRRVLYRLRDGIRHLAGRSRVRGCGRWRIRPQVDITKREGRCNFDGLLRCGSIWECPVCAAAIKAGRAGEVTTAVANHGITRCLMLSLTVKHGLGHDVKALRRGVANAWRKVQAGAPWKRFAAKAGLLGTIRAAEVTEGPYGFHPHLHIVLLSELEADAPEWEELGAWLASRWVEKVEAVLGRQHTPSLDKGAKLSPLRDVDYISKLGLEIAAPGTKAAKWPNRTPLDIAASAAAGNAEDAQLWQTYADGFFRARCLTWSRGLKKTLGVNETSDEETLAEDVLGELVTSLAGCVWDTLRDVPRMKIKILEAAERGGADAVAALVAPHAITSQRENRAKPLPVRAQPEPLEPIDIELPPYSSSEPSMWEGTRDLEWEYDNAEALDRLSEKLRLMFERARYVKADPTVELGPPCDPDEED